MTSERIAALADYGILDTDPEPGFDDIVLLATRLCETPVALVSLVDETRQWFKAKIGFPNCETPLSQSVCAHALKEDSLLVIPDLRLDDRTRHNTLVTAAPHIRFYAGAVLRTPQGIALGTLCVIDLEPRPEGLTAQQAENLQALARQVMTQMEFRRAIAERDAASAAAAAADAAMLRHQTLLREELGHRLKNLLAIVQSVVSQTLRSADSLDGAQAALSSRIVALGKAQDILISGEAAGASLADVVRGAVDLHDAGGRLSVSGGDVRLGARATLLFALTLHELATNALKYGALSTPGGTVAVDWQFEAGSDGPALGFLWREDGGPPVAAPTRRGFGTRLIETVFAGDVGGEASIDYRERGLEYRLTAPFAGLRAD